VSEKHVKVVEEVFDEYQSAKRKHGEYTLDGSACTDINRLAALTEELGEVARCMTYDKEHSKNLKHELIQVANLAITWASIL